MNHDRIIEHRGVRNVVRRKVGLMGLIREAFRKEAPKDSTPTLADLGRNFAKATATWAASGFKVRDESDYKRISAICDSCEHWDKSGYFLAGKCNKCGCTALKRFLKTEKCPIAKW